MNASYYILEARLLSGSEWFDTGKIYTSERSVRDAKRQKEEARGKSFEYRIKKC